MPSLQDAYWKMASALVEADGMECTDPDEVYVHPELLVSFFIITFKWTCTRSSIRHKAHLQFTSEGFAIRL